MVSRWENELKQSEITGAFQNELLAAGKADELPPERRLRIASNIGVAIGIPASALLESGSNVGSGLGSGAVGSGAVGSGAVGSGGLGSGGLGSGGLGSGVGPAGLGAAASKTAASSAQVGGLQGLVSSGLLTKVVGTAILGSLSVWGGYTLFAPNDSSGDVPAGGAVEAAATLVDAPVAEPSPTTIDAKGKHPEPADETLRNPSLVSRDIGVGDLQPESEAVEGVAKARRHTASDALTRELALIEAGRADLLRNNPSATLDTLRKHRKEFPKGTLLAEATVLRVEALIASGNRKAASEVGEAFLRRSPNSPYSRRISSLLGGARDPATKAGETSR